MKKNDIVLSLATIAFTALFYQQQLGINLLLFNVLLIVLLVVTQPDCIKKTSWWAVALSCIVSAAAVYYHGMHQAIVLNILSLLLLPVFTVTINTSIIFAAIHSLYTQVTVVVFMIIDYNQKQPKQTGKPLTFKLILIVLPLLVTCLFFFMYQSANPVFHFFTQKLNLDFISWPWLRFVLLGLLLMYAFFYVRQIKWLAAIDSAAKNNLETSPVYKSWWGKNFTLMHEFTLAKTILFLLNILLLTVNVLDVVYLWGGAGLPVGLNYTDFVHQGTGMLIASIVLAILLILYFFRGALHFYTDKKVLIILCCLWIVQNIFMIVSTAYRNHIYIEDYFLTYKRLGVYVYLLLCVFGLITTAIKIIYKKSNWYLFRVNSWIVYIVLLTLSFYNWDAYITQYNIAAAEIKNRPIDKNYLADLSFNNLTQLLLMNDSIKQVTVAEDEHVTSSISFKRKFYDSYFYERDFKSRLHFKLYKFLELQNNTQWPSYVFNYNHIAKQVDVLAKNKFSELHLSNQGIETLKPIESLKNIQYLDVSHNPWKQEADLSSFKFLKNLNISYTQLDTLDSLPILNHLQTLNISGLENLQFQKLNRWKNVTSVDASKTNLTSIKQLPLWPKLTGLILAENEISDLNDLVRYKNLHMLDLSNALAQTQTLPVLPTLDTLNLSNNQGAMQNASLLDYLPFNNLKNLNLSFNKIKHFPVSSNQLQQKASLCLSLLELNLSNNEMGSLTGLQSFSNLVSLNVADNKLTDISDIASLNHLKILNLNNNRYLKQLEPVTLLKTVTTLDIGGNKWLKDYQMISDMQQLKVLDMSDMNIDSIEFLNPLQQLTYLDLSYNHITHIEVLASKQNLQELILSGNIIHDLTPLYKLKNLKRLVLINVAGIEQLRNLKQALPHTELITSMDDSALKTTAIEPLN
ncbi:MAG: DUF4173 domain-containing protein [Bacteroidia bacterium]|nr:DUF4173 domain-containing protein [Bacteroidia bacterium]